MYKIVMDELGKEDGDLLAMFDGVDAELDEFLERYPRRKVQ